MYEYIGEKKAKQTTILNILINNIFTAPLYFSIENNLPVKSATSAIKNEL